MVIDYKQILSTNYLGNTVQDYLILLGVFLFAIIILKIFKTVIVVRMKKLAKKTKTTADDIVIRVIDELAWPFYLGVALYVAMRFITLPEGIGRWIEYAIFIVVAIYIVRSFVKLIKYSMHRVVEKKKDAGEDFDEASLDVVNKMISIVIWSIALLLILSNLGIDVSTLIAGLGIGGIAIAFALQNVLSDIFASVSIYLDKPFKIGDFIIIGEDMGVIKKIGIKTTRIQALKGEEIVVSNKELTSTRIHNYKKMKKRRIVFKFGVTYGTQTKKLEKIPKIVEQIIKKIKLADFDRAHFNEFGDFSLNFEVVYYLKSSDYNEYMDTQQDINLQLKKALDKEKVEFAFPTQTVYVGKLK
jgi:small-conductance mechanosensitive channel